MHYLSLPLRKCGLKQIFFRKLAVFPKSLPLRKCGLKPGFTLLVVMRIWSLPLRKCGLKLETGLDRR